VLNFLAENNSISCATVVGKHAPERKSEPFTKRIDIDLEMKIRIICKYEVGKSFSAIACELDVNTT
jgi:hypothetical protein